LKAHANFGPQDYTIHPLGADPAVGPDPENPIDFSFPQGKILFQYDPMDLIDYWKDTPNIQCIPDTFPGMQLWVEDREQPIVQKRWRPIPAVQDIPPDKITPYIDLMKRDDGESCLISSTFSSEANSMAHTALGKPPFPTGKANSTRSNEHPTSPTIGLNSTTSARSSSKSVTSTKFTKSTKSATTPTRTTTSSPTPTPTQKPFVPVEPVPVKPVPVPVPVPDLKDRQCHDRSSHGDVNDSEQASWAHVACQKFEDDSLDSGSEAEIYNPKGEYGGTLPYHFSISWIQGCKGDSQNVGAPLKDKGDVTCVSLLVEDYKNCKWIFS
jgi:hypothetical protein